MTTKQTSPTNGMINIPAAEYMGISIFCMYYFSQNLNKRRAKS